MRPRSRLLCTVLLLLLPTITSAAWTTGGSLIAEGIGERYGTALIADASGGVISAWTDRRDLSGQIYMQRTAADGTTLWAMNGEPIPSSESAFAPRLLPDGSGGAFVSFVNGTLSSNIVVQRVDGGGTELWNELVSVSPSAGDGSRVRMIGDGAGGVVVAWWRQGLIEDRGLFVQRIDGSGNRLWGNDAVRVSDYDGTPDICGDGAGGVYITWADRRVLPHTDIYAQHVSGAGAVSWPANGLTICDAELTQQNPHIVADGSGGAIIAWRDYGQPFGGIYAQRIDAAGTPAWTTNGVSVYASTFADPDFAMESDGAGGAVFAIASGRLNDTHIRAQRIDGAAQSLWSNTRVTSTAAAGKQTDPRLVVGAAGDVYFAWYDYRTGCQDIFAQKFNAAGSTVWALDGVMVAVFDESQLEPALVAGGPEEFYAFWRDTRGDDDRLFLLPIGAAGSGVSEECESGTPVPKPGLSLLRLSNRPNPFNPSTEFRFTLPADGPVELVVYDLAGREIVAVTNRIWSAGTHTIVWRGRGEDGRELASGVYVARLRHGGKAVHRKVALVR